MDKGRTTTLVAAARASALSVAQSQEALACMRREFPAFSFSFSTLSSPGDRDTTTPIENGAPDFFTRDLDEALLDGKIDFAIHSAKDLPERMPEGLDWFWLPAAADPRDAWVFPDSAGGLEDLKKREGLRLGISSARRAAFAAKEFPAAVAVNMRGTVDARLEQLKAGSFDAAIMAKAGLDRLYGGTPPGVRVVPIPLSELPVPDGQGRLAVTFRKGDERLLRMRWRFVKAVRFVSAGVGDAGMCTLAGAEDLRAADTILHDSLIGEGMGSLFAAGAHDKHVVFVGKRCGAHAAAQEEITRRICDEARKGRRVVRLKGGDAGLFGRLSEETDALAALRLPFIVRPGVSALVAATTGTGMLLTRRGASDGFTVRTPRSSGRERPYVSFMAVEKLGEEASALIASGRAPETPCAIVFDAMGPREETIRFGLADAAAGRVAPDPAGRPGLFVAGECAADSWPASGELGGLRVLLTCSEHVLPAARIAVEDRGGRPVLWPMIELRAASDLSYLGGAGAFDAIILTSPAAVRIFFANCGADRRTLPKFFVCGPGTAACLRDYGIFPDVMPETDFSARGLAAALLGGKAEIAGKKILRLRSDRAGSGLSDALAAAGADVEDRVLYVNSPIARSGPPPAFDAVHFASSSAVDAFAAAYGPDALGNAKIFVQGAPTRKRLESLGIGPERTSLLQVVSPPQECGCDGKGRDHV